MPDPMVQGGAALLAGFLRRKLRVLIGVMALFLVMLFAFSGLTWTTVFIAMLTLVIAMIGVLIFAFWIMVLSNTGRTPNRPNG